ncbi:hypothetical protein IM043_gp236 [Bacillus phage SPG24]|nr:hypothetical protein IM043_gp236 [Bacillus phage SPG24]
MGAAVFNGRVLDVGLGYPNKE